MQDKIQYSISFATCSTMTQIYKIGSDIASPPKKKKLGPISITILAISQLCNANVSGMQQDIVKRKTALQTAISPAHVYLLW